MRFYSKDGVKGNELLGKAKVKWNVPTKLWLYTRFGVLIWLQFSVNTDTHISCSPSFLIHLVLGHSSHGKKTSK